METEDISAWVPLPEPVRRAAAVYGAGHPMIKRLLSDPAMARVWRYFHKHSVRGDFRARFEDGTNLPPPDLQGLDLHWHDTSTEDQAVVFLFFAILIAANNTREIPDQILIDSELEKLRETQRLVDRLRTWAPWPVLEVEPHIDRAIKDIVKLCEERISLLDYSKKPNVVEVKGPDSTIRSTVRSIGAATHALYGECSYGQLATIANVMFAPVERIDSGKAEKWCTRPRRLPLMDVENGRDPKIPTQNGRGPKK